MATGTLTELTLIWQSRLGPPALADLDAMLSRYEIDIEPGHPDDLPIMRHAIEAYAFGRRAEPACLNFGDLFAYILAKRLDLPLLHKGGDFTRTYIIPALPIVSPMGAAPGDRQR